MDDFYNAVRKEITMVRGDSMAFNFQLQGLKGSTPNNIKFTCKEHYDDDTGYFMQSLNGGGITLIGYDAQTDTATYCCRVRPDQTVNLVPARYYYDLELEVGNDVFTLMKGRLTVEYDVSN
jgi:hypothetical protein